MNDIVLLGAGGHARAVYSIINQGDQFKVTAVLDIKSGVSPNTKDAFGVEVHRGIGFLSSLSPDYVCVFICVGDNGLRRKYSEICVGMNFCFPNIIHPTAYIDPSAKIGHGNFVGAFANIGADVAIGDGNIINTLSNLDHEVVAGCYNHFSPGATVCGRCLIHDNTWVGAGATLIDNISIASDTIIGAGAVIVSDILAGNNTYVGVPGKSL